jgi:hypothetical protein
VRYEELHDQPPEVTTTEPGLPGSLPPARAAAERVRAFLADWGDGIVVEGRDEEPSVPILYARDLESLARAALAPTDHAAAPTSERGA